MNSKSWVNEEGRSTKDNPAIVVRQVSLGSRDVPLGSRDLQGADVATANCANVAYREGQIEGVVFKPLVAHRDGRGWLIELYREDEMPLENHPVMSYLSETLPGVVRGPHEHVDQSDYFAFVGPGDFEVHLWDARPESATFGNKLVCVVGESNPHGLIVPPGVVHAYKNVSDRPGWVFNAPNRLYAGAGKREPVDEIRHENTPGSPFRVGPDA